MSHWEVPVEEASHSLNVSDYELYYERLEMGRWYPFDSQRYEQATTTVTRKSVSHSVSRVLQPVTGLLPDLETLLMALETDKQSSGKEEKRQLYKGKPRKSKPREGKPCECKPREGKPREGKPRVGEPREDELPKDQPRQGRHREGRHREGAKMGTKMSGALEREQYLSERQPLVMGLPPLDVSSLQVSDESYTSAVAMRARKAARRKRINRKAAGRSSRPTDVKADKNLHDEQKQRPSAVAHQKVNERLISTSHLAAEDEMEVSSKE